MRQLTLLRDLEGTLTEVGPGLLDASLGAADGAATLVSQLRFVRADRFSEDGRIELAGDGTLYFRTLFDGQLASAPDPKLRVGAAVREIVSGSGALAGAAGRITSTFVVDREGKVSDREVALVFLAERSNR